jgi:nondiscriminating aspartyl-tRNA synthetase
LIFIDLRDRSGMVQVVIIPDSAEAYEKAKNLRSEYVVSIEGLVKERPMSAQNVKIGTGAVEIEAKNIEILQKTEGELPVDISAENMDLNLETLLNYRLLTLRNAKVKAIFKVYADLLYSYSQAMRSEGFTEIKSPKIISNASEGGANFFKIKYFDREAFLAQSPQFYKQAGVGIFERVFEIGSVFRAEPHFTSRHVNEYIGLDAEMGFIDGIEEIMHELEKVLALMMKFVKKSCAKEIGQYQANVPRIKIIPRLKLTEALAILEKEYGKKTEGIDIDPEGERQISEYVKKKYKSDFVFLTHYPSAIRPFYAMPSADPQFTESFDLLFRGIEIASGGQRIHDYNQLVANIKKHKLNPEEFSSYLDTFKHGMPPHGGWGLGSERIVQKLLGLQSIKEAILFPRDVKRLTP